MITPVTLTASGNVPLNDASVRVVGRWLVSVKKTGSGTFTIKPQKRVHVLNGFTPHAYQDCWYTLALANTPILAGVEQTTNVMLDIDSSGSDINLVVAIAGTASVEVIATPLAG